MDQVSCYSGSSYADRPQLFTWQNKTRVVQEARISGRLPDGIFFVVRADDSNFYRLVYNFLRDNWLVQPE